jgi:hypothetical protein
VTDRLATESLELKVFVSRRAAASCKALGDEAIRKWRICFRWTSTYRRVPLKRSSGFTVTPARAEFGTLTRTRTQKPQPLQH